MASAAAFGAALPSVGDTPDIALQDPDGEPAKGLSYVPQLQKILDLVPGPAFPPADLLTAAAGVFPLQPAWDGSEGPRWRVLISPGAVAVGATNTGRSELALEREHQRNVKLTEQIAAAILAGDVDQAEPRGREQMRWSDRSRARMTRALCELDYLPLFAAGFLVAMTTLTYPGDWEIVAPSGKALKRHVEAFKSRYRYAWGRVIVGVWKLEFQRRGAPHVHILMAPPHGRARAGRGVGAGLPFKGWLSAVWADVVAHPDPVERMKHERAGTNVDYSEGLRMTDPKRVAVYFTKHGTFRAKDYQNIVPALWRGPGVGPGRFWGYWGLARTVVTVQASPDGGVWSARLLRRWSRAQGQLRVVTSLHGRQRRKQVRRTAYLAHGAGWVSCNDGAVLGASLGRAIDLLTQQGFSGLSALETYTQKGL